MSDAMALLEEWISEVKAEAVARGAAEGRIKGRNKVGRKFLTRLLNKKFGEIPPHIRERIERADFAWCERMIDVAVNASSFGELDLS